MQEMVRKVVPEPLAHEIKASQLRVGMITFIRTIDAEGNVKFTPDLSIRKVTEPIGCSGLHFIAHSLSPKRSGGDMQVCYWSEARVWVKEPENG